MQVDEYRPRRYGAMRAIGRVAGMAYRNRRAIRRVGGRIIRRIHRAWISRSGPVKRKAGVMKRVGPSKRRKLPPRKSAVGARRRLGFGGIPSTFAGKFPAVVNRPKFSKFAYTGYRKETEIHGVVSASNVARICVNAYPVDETIQDVFISLFRWHLKKYAQIDVYSPDQFLFALSTAPTYYLGFATITGKATMARYEVSYACDSSDTLKDLAAWAAWEHLNAKFTNPNTYLERIRVSNASAVGGASTQNIELAGLKISLYSKAEINIQNSTASGSSISGVPTTDDVFNNPIVGNVVYGKGLTVIPRVLDEQGTGTIAITNTEWPFAYELKGDGVILSSAAGLGIWRAVQPASQFRNSVKQQYLSLNPGESKCLYLRYKYVGSLRYFLDNYAKGFKNATGTLPTTGPVHEGADVQGPSLNKYALIQFEKRLQGDASVAQPVRINYQIDFHHGCRVVNGPSSLHMNVDYQQATRDAVE